MNELIYGIIWGLIGGSGFIFWWTKDYDLTLQEFLLVLFGTILGPLAWIVGWFIHTKSLIVIKKKSKE